MNNEEASERSSDLDLRAMMVKELRDRLAAFQDDDAVFFRLIGGMVERRAAVRPMQPIYGTPQYEGQIGVDMGYEHFGGAVHLVYQWRVCCIEINA